MFWTVIEKLSNNESFEHRVEFFNKEFHGHNNLFKSVVGAGLNMSSFLTMLHKHPSGSFKNLSWVKD